MSTKGLSVTAKVKVTAANGNTATSGNNEHDVVGWKTSGLAQIASIDKASEVLHESYRKFISGSERETTIYQIY